MSHLFNPAIKKCMSFFMIALLLFQTFSCKYFEVNTLAPENYPRIEDMGKIHKTFVLHSGHYRYLLNEPRVDSLYLSGTIKEPDIPLHYTEDRNVQYASDEKNIINEVHIYLKESYTSLPLGPASIRLADINEVRIIDKDTRKNNTSAVFTTVGIAAFAFVLMLIIGELIKSSCPYVYVHDGNGFIFEGETYGGAIAKNLARDDYMPLPSIRPSEGLYKIRLSNELKERQYTDLANLIVISHPEGSRVLIDKYGSPFLITEPEKPVMAISATGEDIRPLMGSKDRAIYMFNDPDRSRNAIYLTFQKPERAVRGKLLLNARNSLWFDYLFGEFLSGFGTAYDNWMEKQALVPPEERRQRMLDSDIPLSIFVKQGDDWKLIDYLFTPGPLASRDFVIPIDLPGVNNQTVDIKIETGFMFWEVDYAAMDFTADQEVVSTIIKPSLAVGTGGADWKGALLETDGVFMSQENTGEITEITFKAPEGDTGMEQSVFLHTYGYYELVREFEGPPKVEALSKFKVPGYFSEYSRMRYLQVLGEGNVMASRN